MGKMLESSWGREFGAECFGTFVLVFFGVGSVQAAVLAGAQAGLWQVAVVWGVGITLAIYSVGAVSGAHINPAITVAFWLYRGFPGKKVPLFVAAQLCGAFLGAAVLFFFFRGFLDHFEMVHRIVRGAPGSELSAMVFGEYFPNPAIAVGKGGMKLVSRGQAMAAEGLGTALLAFFIFALTDVRNVCRPLHGLPPVFIGLTVSLLISILAPISQAGLNPARDFGPRLFAWLAGWGRIAIPGPRHGFFLVYIRSPVLGAAAGGGAYILGGRRQAAVEETHGVCKFGEAAGGECRSLRETGGRDG